MWMEHKVSEKLLKDPSERPGPIARSLGEKSCLVTNGGPLETKLGNEDVQGLGGFRSSKQPKLDRRKDS